MPVPIYAGLLNGWFWEAVWVWEGYWKLENSHMQFLSYSASDPCGAFNPIELGGRAFFYHPPYRIYEVWRYLAGEWMRCYSERNW